MGELYKFRDEIESDAPSFDSKAEWQYINDIRKCQGCKKLAGILAVLEEVDECAAYWSEYDVPLGLHDRIKAAIAKTRGKA